MWHGHTNDTDTLHRSSDGEDFVSSSVISLSPLAEIVYLRDYPPNSQLFLLSMAEQPCNDYTSLLFHCQISRE